VFVEAFRYYKRHLRQVQKELLWIRRETMPPHGMPLFPTSGGHVYLSLGGRFQRIRKSLSYVVLGMLSLGLVAAAPPVTSCDLARDWVRAHARSLPQTRTEIQEYAAPWRRAIFAELSPNVRARLWREHLSDILASHTLREPQRAFVVEVAGNVDRMKMLTKVQAEAEIVARWMPRVQQLFPGDRKTQTSRIFYQVFEGPDADGLRPKVLRASLVPGFASLYIRKVARRLSPSVYASMVDCNCHGGFGGCGMFDCSTQGTCSTPPDCTFFCPDGQCY